MSYKKIVLFISALFLFIPFFSSAQETDWVIKNYDVVLKVEKNNELFVTESIGVDFFAEKHGIFRYIPIKYRDDNNFKYDLKIEMLSITDDKDNAYNFATSYEGDNYYIKIGDPNATITGEHLYKINYKIKRGIRFFNDHDELYWNATGNEWPVPIQNSSSQIIYPEGIDQKDLMTKCFTGSFGSTEQNCTIDFSQNSVLYSAKNLEAYQGLTVVFGLPKGIIVEPTVWEKIRDFLYDNWGFLLPIFAFAAVFYLWYTKGRDPALKGTIIAQYEPPDNLTPAEMGCLLDEKVQVKDITADIIHLAVKGYLKIKEYKKDSIFKSTAYELIKQKEQDDKLKDSEKELLEDIFGSKTSIKMDDLKDKFYTNIPTLQDKIYKQVVSYEYFPQNPKKVRALYYVFGILFMASVIPLSIFGRLDICFGFFASGIIIMCFAHSMPRKTRKGSDAYWHVLGLKEFISVAEKYRIKFQEKENIFEVLLPYAMVLGVADKWAKAFKDIYNGKPDWYESSDNQVFNSVLLYSALSSFHSSSGSIMRSAPGQSSSGSSGFSSGGSSGGGFGGGGGGSW